MEERVIRGGIVVLPDGPLRADIRVRGGRIAEIGPGLDPAGATTVDAGELHLLPGAIDTHGHQWEPGFTTRLDFEETTASAAVGGVTTLLDHPLTPPLVLDRVGFEAKVALGRATSVIDFGLHGGAAPDHLNDLAGLWAAGATGIKVFTCPTGTALDGFDDPGRLDALFARLGTIGARALVHAEEATVLAAARAALEADGQTGVADFPRWHTLEAEQRAVAAVLAVAERHGVEVLIVHASHPSIVAATIAARGRGVRAFVETCPHYLHLDDGDLARLGSWAMTAPPVRDRASRDALREQLGAGAIDVIGSDHCAIGRPGKSGAAMTSLIPGVPGLDVFLPLLLDLVAEGVLDWRGLAEATSTRPARLFGLPGKGALIVGNDADIAFVEPDRTWTIEAAALPSSAGWSPYDGRTIRGAVQETWSRGVAVARDGKPIGRPGHGRFIARAA